MEVKCIICGSEKIFGEKICFHEHSDGTKHYGNANFCKLCFIDQDLYDKGEKG